MPAAALLAVPRREDDDLGEAYLERCRRLAREVFVHVAQSFLDRSWLWHAPPEVVRRRVVITGLGAVSPVGTGVEEFTAGIRAGAWLVMSGHLDVRAVDPGVPASFSRKVLVDLLRTRLGFDGVVVSDALNMAPARRWPPGEAAVRALLAGNDLLLMPPDLPAAYEGLRGALKDGRLPRARLLYWT